MIRKGNMGRAGAGGWGWSLSVAAMLVLGGGNWTMPLSRFLAELIGAGLLLAAIGARRFDRPLRMTAPDWLWAALAGLFIFHLLPLPAWAWTRLPGRELAAMTDHSVFGAIGWRPLTLDSEATWRSLLMLLPAFSVYLAVRLGDGERLAALLRGAVIAGAIAIAVAFLQLALPHEAALHFYPRGDYDEPVGFFTNRNHQASFLLCALPLAACWLLPGRDRAIGAWRTASIRLAVAAMFGGVAVLVTGSRAGAALLPLALGATAMAWAQASSIAATSGKSARTLRVISIGGALVAGFAALVLLIVALGGDGVDQVLRRAPVSADSRLAFWPVAINAAAHFWPIGSGLGTFLNAYEMVEPLEALRPLYVNHAHNDFLEIVVEAGVPGLVLALAGVWELAVMGWRAWHTSPVAMPDTVSARFASIAIAMPLAHSLVDYPLRTVAISSLFAMAAAMLARCDSALENPQD